MLHGEKFSLNTKKFRNLIKFFLQFSQILVDLDQLADNMPKIKRCNSEPSLLHYTQNQPPPETFVPQSPEEDDSRYSVTMGTLV